MSLLKHTVNLTLALTFAGICQVVLAMSPQAQAQPPELRAALAQHPPPIQEEPATEPAENEEEIPPADSSALFPTIAARVNGKAVAGRDLEQLIRTELASIGSPEWRSLREDYRQELINNSLGSLIAKELIYQKASSSGIEVTDAEVQEEFDKVAKTFASDAQMNTALAGRGIDRSGLRKELRQNLIMAKFIEANVTPNIVIKPDEVSQYYSSHKDELRHGDIVRTSHILFAVPEGSKPDQDRLMKQRAEAILARVNKGEDFAKLARENSMDSSASQGGDIGYVSKGQLVPEYEDAAFALAIGESMLVRTQFGYHIIKVTDKKKEGLWNLEDIRDQLTDFLMNQKAESYLDNIVSDLRAVAKIEVFVPLSAGAEAEGKVTSPPVP